MPSHIRVFLAFFIYALALGSIYPRIGDLQLQMGIGESALGLALIGPGFGAFIALMLSGFVLARLSHKQVLVGGIIVIACLMALASWSTGPLALFLALFVAGLVIGVIEVVINLEADRTEHLISRRIMSRCHAFWSFGFFTAGLIGAAAKQVGLSPQLHLGLMVPLIGVATWVFLAPLESAPARPRESSDGQPHFAVPSLGVMALVALTLSALLLEGAGFDWSVIYMRDNFSQAPFINGMAITAGALAQAITRYYADHFLSRWGPLVTARVLLIILAAGATVVVVSSHAYISLAGFALIGIGASALFPIAISAAAQRTDRPAALNVAALSQFAFVAFLVGPPILGIVAEHFGVRAAYAVCIPFIVVSFLASGVLRPRHQQH